MQREALTEKLKDVHGLSQFSTALWLHERAEEIGSYGLIIEVGTWVGYTGIAMALGGPRVICVDTFDARDEFTGEVALGRLQNFYTLTSTPNMYEIFMRNIERAGVRHRINPIKGESVPAAVHLRMGLHPDVYVDTRPADLIFIDADHRYENVRDDIAAWERLLKPGGLLVVDNYTGTKGVAGAFNEFVLAKDYPSIELAPHVMGYVRKP